MTDAPGDAREETSPQPVAVPVRAQPAGSRARPSTVAEIEPDSGNCGRSETWPAEGEYRLDETVAGRMLCMDVTDQATIYWTDERLYILSLATSAANDRTALWRFWLDDSGPDL